jgi:hypothetical protein
MKKMKKGRYLTLWIALTLLGLVQYLFSVELFLANERRPYWAAFLFLFLSFPLKFTLRVRRAPVTQQVMETSAEGTLDASGNDTQGVGTHKKKRSNLWSSAKGLATLKKNVQYAVEEMATAVVPEELRGEVTNGASKLRKKYGPADTKGPYLPPTHHFLTLLFPSCPSSLPSHLYTRCYFRILFFKFH